jgi:hypothetical protein
MQTAVVKGFDKDTINIVMKEEEIEKFTMQILFWIDMNEYWVYIADEDGDTDLRLKISEPKEALYVYDEMKRFIKREILKESD